MLRLPAFRLSTWGVLRLSGCATAQSRQESVRVQGQVQGRLETPVAPRSWRRTRAASGAWDSALETGVQIRGTADQRSQRPTQPWIESSARGNEFTRIDSRRFLGDLGGCPWNMKWFLQPVIRRLLTHQVRFSYLIHEKRCLSRETCRRYAANLRLLHPTPHIFHVLKLPGMTASDCTARN